MRVLVTGAAGFIGSHLTERLVKLGHEVRAIDNLLTGKRANLENAMAHIEFLQADLAEREVCRAAVSGIEVVFHLAAIASVARSNTEPELAHHANVDATFRLFEASRREGVRRVVYAGSSSVYGNNREVPVSETAEAGPLSIYAAQKHIGELYGAVYFKLHGLQCVSLRYFNIFGPRQDPNGEYSAVLPKFIAMMLSGHRPTIYGDGQTTRDFTYVENVVDANILSMDAPNVSGRSLNIGSGERISLNELASKINTILGTDLPPIYLAERPGDVRHSAADIRLASQLLGYRPRVLFEEGLRRTVEAIQADSSNSLETENGSPART